MRCIAGALLLACVATPAWTADVGVSISVNEPGLYGRIDLGGYPPPQTLYAQPVYVKRGPAARPPVYLHVPPGHAKNWRRYCGRYDACNEPVYFVQDNWYRDVYRPRYREVHGGDRGRGPGRRDDDRRDDDRRGGNDRRDDDGPGRGNGNGRGHGGGRGGH